MAARIKSESKSVQKSLFKFFKRPDPPQMSSVDLLKPIILGLLFLSVDIAEKRKKATRHVAVATETYERWKKLFPWLEVFRPNENETTRLKCSVCRELKKSNVMALDGSPNI